MPDLTPNLNLKKPNWETDVADIRVFNDNMDIIDEKITDGNEAIQGLEEKKQNKEDSTLKTIAKKIVEAINELFDSKLEKGGYTGNAKNLNDEISKKASKTVLGRMIVGDNLTVDDNGRVSATKTEIVNDLTTGGADKAGSAEMVKKLGTDKQDKTDNSLKTPTKNIVGGINDLIWYQKPKQLIGGDSAENAVDLLEYLKTLKEGIYTCNYYGGAGWFKNLPYPEFEPSRAYNVDFFIEIKSYRQRSAFEETTVVKFYSESSDTVGYFEATILYSISSGKFTTWRYNYSSSSKYEYGIIGVRSAKERFIQDKITKYFNYTYQDKDTGKIYRCIATTTNDTTVTSNFELITNNELAKRNSEYIVEYKEIDENTRYRKWNSGLLEIWGFGEGYESMTRVHSIKFPTNFINMNYNIYTSYNTNETSAVSMGVQLNEKTVSGCKVYLSTTSSVKLSYYAVGRWK